MRYKYLCAFLLAAIGSLAFQSSSKNTLRFSTGTGHIIRVSKGWIFYDNKPLQTIKYADDIIYDSKFNRLIEDNGAIFLFVAMGGSPNVDRFNVYTITPSKVITNMSAVLSVIKDYDGDGFLEFGGHDLTEHHPNPDSAYYIPSTYYEIRNGNIKKDITLIKREDIKLNGVYLQPSKQLDENGDCCRLIRAPLKRKN